MFHFLPEMEEFQGWIIVVAPPSLVIDHGLSNLI